MNQNQMCKAKLYINILVLIALSGCGCQNSNPLSPYESATLSAYLPLLPGYKAKYSFRLTSSFWTGAQNDTREVVAACELSVSQILERNLNKYLKISTVFFVEKDIMKWDSEYKGENYNFTKTFGYDMLLSADSAWYVTDAPDFSRLEEGSRTLMMHGPEKEDNYFDLALLAYSGWDHQLKFSGLQAEFKADTLIYSSREEQPLDDQTRIAVKMVKGKGIISFDYWRFEGGGYHTFSQTTILNYLRLSD